VTVTAVQDTEDEDDETVVLDVETVTNGNEDGTQQATTTITDDDGPASFVVSNFAGTSTGFMAQFNAPIDTADLNLYDTSAGLGAADVTLTGASGGAVTGSLVVDSSDDMIYFIATGGTLAADTYTATLRSGADAFEDTTARALGGNGDGTPGDNFVGNFEIVAPAAGSVTLSVDDFVRGPGQPVNLPANVTTGLPVTISDGTGLRNVSLSINYNPAFLEISAAAPGANLPAGATVNLDTSTAGMAVLTVTSTTDLPAGPNTLVDLTASVPTANANAIYLDSQVVNIHTASATDSASNNVPVIDDDGMHVVEYFADVSGNGRVNAADASQVAQVAALLPVDTIPDVPSGVVTSAIVPRRLVEALQTNPAQDANDAALGALGFVDDDLGMADADDALSAPDGEALDAFGGTFSIATPAAGAVTVSLPDFVRGPGQPVNLPADDTTGIPLSLSEGATVRNVTPHVLGSRIIPTAVCESAAPTSVGCASARRRGRPMLLRTEILARGVVFTEGVERTFELR
jgi:hypothetical protein